MRKFLFTLIIGAFFLMVSCKAKTAQVSYWFNESISATLVNSYNVTQLSVYMNDEFVGNMDPNDWKVGPDCGGANFTVTLELAGKQGNYYEFVVNDQAGTTQFQSGVTLSQGECENVQLKW